MPKILKYQKATEESLKTWIEFLSNPESELVSVRKKEDKELNDAYEKLEYISGDERLRRLAELRLKAILDENSMKAESYDKGKKERNKGAE